jgi:D-alanyl-D-alanine carboxypeptidase/D-alanyl-D-alanine-endopeptidase (penicillin-binding protein 4)
LAKAGITSYRNLIIDDRVFDGEFLHPNWPANQRGDAFEARIGALNFSNNLKDGAPVADPGAWAGGALKQRLTAAGIKCTGALMRVPADTKYDGTLVAVQETPIIAVITRANTNSINMMAEGLCKRLGHDATNQPGSWQNGTAAVEAYLKSIKIPPGTVTLDDGSGLSDKNKATARAFTAVLAHVGARADGDIYVQSFATPGVGSLVSRFKDAGTRAAAGAIHAKTGHISNVSTLSGYLEVHGRRFAFSILCNNYYKAASRGDAAVSNVNPWQDRVVTEIYNWAK